MAGSTHAARKRALWKCDFAASFSRRAGRSPHLSPHTGHLGGGHSLPGPPPRWLVPRSFGRQLPRGDAAPRGRRGFFRRRFFSRGRFFGRRFGFFFDRFFDSFLGPRPPAGPPAGRPFDFFFRHEFFFHRFFVFGFFVFAGFDFFFRFGARLAFGFLGFLRRFPGFLFRQVFFLDFFPGGDHAGPDHRREGAAHHRAAVVERQHRRGRVRVADPDAGGHFGGDAAAEPGVALFLGGAGLAPLFRRAGVGRGPGALADHGFHDRLLLLDRFFVEDLVVDRLVFAAADRLAVLGDFGVGDRGLAGDRREGAGDAVAVVADRRVGVGPAER